MLKGHALWSLYSEYSGAWWSWCCWRDQKYWLPKPRPLLAKQDAFVVCLRDTRVMLKWHALWLLYSECSGVEADVAGGTRNTGFQSRASCWLSMTLLSCACVTLGSCLKDMLCGYCTWNVQAVKLMFLCSGTVSLIFLRNRQRGSWTGAWGEEIYSVVMVGDGSHEVDGDRETREWGGKSY